MTRVEIWTLLAAGVIGLILGTGYFAGLWWTLGRVSRASRPTIWLAGSFLIRVVLIMAAFYLLLLQGLAALAVALVGFLLARFFWLQRKKPANYGRSLRKKAKE